MRYLHAIITAIGSYSGASMHTLSLTHPNVLSAAARSGHSSSMHSKYSKALCRLRAMRTYSILKYTVNRCVQQVQRVLILCYHCKYTEQALS
jgi:hypothetical protein